MSPAEREGSKEIFGLIKKLNGVPDTRRKAKMTCMICSMFHIAESQECAAYIASKQVNFISTLMASNTFIHAISILQPIFICCP